jgi:hypothetical protein
MPTGFTVDTESYWKNGYTIVRNVFTPEEIQNLREGAFASRESRGRASGDLLSNPWLKSILVDGRLVEIAREILGRDDIVYYGDSTYTIKPGTVGYHKDNADRSDPNAPDWQGDRYTQIRFGIYLQDHKKHSGGLNVRRGSHNIPSNTGGKTVYLRSGVGDVGVWSLRTSHSAGGVILKFPRWINPDPARVKWYPKRLHAPRHQDRISLFAALGADDHHAARYIEYLKTRTYMVNIFRASVYDDDTLREAEKVGLHVRDMRKEIEGDDTVGKNVTYAPIPY